MAEVEDLVEVIEGEEDVDQAGVSLNIILGLN